MTIMLGVVSVALLFACHLGRRLTDENERLKAELRELRGGK